MPEIDKCGSSFDIVDELVDHLAFDQDWQELSRIIRKRVETYSPAKSSEATAPVIENRMAFRKVRLPA